MFDDGKKNIIIGIKWMIYDIVIPTELLLLLLSFGGLISRPSSDRPFALKI
jgi:hypothetical protein